MSTIAAALRGRELGRDIGPIDLRSAYRWLALLALSGLLALTSAQVPGAVEAVADAYLEIAVFVAFTLFLVYSAEVSFRTGLGDLLRRHASWQVPIAALLGAFPGCGGAIVAVTQFTRGHMSFGGVVATLTATMGDAMFLLIAAEPMTALTISGVSILVGITSGYLVDLLHGADFLRPATARCGNRCDEPRSWIDGREGASDWLWLAMMALAIVVGLPLAMVEFDLLAWVGLPESAAATLALSGAAWASCSGPRTAIPTTRNPKRKRRAPRSPAPSSPAPTSSSPGWSSPWSATSCSSPLSRSTLPACWAPPAAWSSWPRSWSASSLAAGPRSW